MAVLSYLLLARAIAAGCSPIGILDLAQYWRFLLTEASVTVRFLRGHSRIVEHTVETTVEPSLAPKLWGTIHIDLAVALCSALTHTS
jgi:hypothetical protein